MISDFHLSPPSLPSFPGAHDGTLGPSVAFVERRELPVGHVKWKDDLANRYNNPGNVSDQSLCTGTLISNDLMLTAGHCFDVDGGGWTWPRDDGTGQAISSAVGATEMEVEFNFQEDGNGSVRTPTAFAIAELMEYRLGSLDYAVVRLQGSPGDTYGVTIPSPFQLGVDDDITIIQHPAGLPKKIHAGEIASLGANGLVTYSTADTTGGSSGSGVLNEATGFISAVHTSAGCTATGGANRGVTVAAIQPNSPIIQRVGFDTAKLVTVM